MRNPIFNRTDAKPLNFQIRNAADGVELLLLDPIGDTFGTSTATDVAAFLKKHGGEPVNVRINSPGGFAFEGIAIHNALISHGGKVTVTIEGVAASAAAIVAMAGDMIRMFENATLMIHRGWQVSIGNVDDHAETINILQRLDEQLATTISARRGIPKSKVVKLMRGEDGADGTWFSAAEALSAKLVDEVIELGAATKRKIGNRAVRDQEARARRLRLMELDGHKWESKTPNVAADRTMRHASGDLPRSKATHGSTQGETANPKRRLPRRHRADNHRIMADLAAAGVSWQRCVALCDRRGALQKSKSKGAMSRAGVRHKTSISRREGRFNEN